MTFCLGDLVQLQSGTGIVIDYERYNGQEPLWIIYRVLVHGKVHKIPARKMGKKIIKSVKKG